MKIWLSSGKLYFHTVLITEEYITGTQTYLEKVLFRTTEELLIQ